ncbi:MAG: DUF554 domain-containing protein [Treponema sp.]|nr:DUF554 domain-containing protein [Treponema sp.]
MLAVLVNCLTVIVGSIVGLLFSKKFTDELLEMIQTACGVITVIIGLQMAFKYESIVYLALSLIIGGVIGYAIDIDGAILRLGGWLQKITTPKKKTAVEGDLLASDITLDEQKKHNFAFAFLNASVLFCVGAMTIIGSFKAGVEHDYTIIFTKSILDGFMAISFAAAMGVGTAFSVILILLYQGGLTLLSGVLQPFVTDSMLNEISACGGAVIIMIGLNLLGLKKIKTANFLPGLLIEVVFVICVPLVKGLFV